VFRIYRYVYYRLYKWHEKQRQGDNASHFVAGYLLCLLMYFPLLLLATIGKVFFGAEFLLASTRDGTVVQLSILALILFAIVYTLLIREGRWRAILNEFSHLSSEDAIRADRAYSAFIRGSIGALLVSIAIGVAAGLLRA
jgi:hypothetical protein